MEMKALRSSVSASAWRMSALSNGGELWLMMMLMLTLFDATTHTAFGACGLDVLEQRDRDLGRERHVERSGDESQNGGRAIRNDGDSMPSRWRQALLSSSRDCGPADRFVGLELDEFEGPVPIGCTRISPGETWQG